MHENEKIQLFERAPIPRAVAKLAVPMIFSSLVMVLYNMADTYFVGMMNDPVENAAVSLASPVLLAFNAVNNLFGVGTSSMMSRALGRKDYKTVSESSAFGSRGCWPKRTSCSTSTLRRIASRRSAPAATAGGTGTRGR